MCCCGFCCHRRGDIWGDGEKASKEYLLVLAFVGIFVMCTGIIFTVSGFYADFWPDFDLYPYSNEEDHIINKMFRTSGYTMIGVGCLIVFVACMFYWCIVTGYLDVSTAPRSTYAGWNSTSTLSRFDEINEFKSSGNNKVWDRLPK